jgi:quercetin dioxygenase-like cupin family protein
VWQHDGMTNSSVRRETLAQHALEQPLCVASVEIRRISLIPNAALGAHVHNGPVFGSIETGSVIFQVEDGESVVLRAGDVFYEPSGVQISKFDSTDEGVTFLGYFLLGAGEDPELTFVT